MLFLAIHAFPP